MRKKKINPIFAPTNTTKNRMNQKKTRKSSSFSLKIVLTIVWLATLITPLQAQDNHTTLFLEESLELLTSDDDTYNWEEELEELSQKLQEPLNLNTATREQLSQFTFLTDKQIENLLAYIYLHGPMQTIYELQQVEDMDKQSIQHLLPFVCVQPVERKPKYPSLKQLLHHARHEALARVDIPFYTRKGYESTYLGPKLYHSMRYSIHYGDYLQAGITAEKDAGEPMFALHNSKGYDFYSPYLLIRNWGRLKALALGNYRLSFGLGLVMSTDFRLGKTYSSSSSANYRSGGIRKHSSSDEYNFFRGAAATVELAPRLQLSAFYSHRRMDGTVKDSIISSISKTGLHRSQSEADKRNAFSLQLAGGNISYLGNAVKVGVTGIYYFFSLPYEPSRSTYAKYYLHGKEFYNASIDYRLRAGYFTLTGEAATGRSGYALLNQLAYSPSANYQLLLIHRYYAHDYWAFFARSFGESSTPQNENGWYLAAEASPFAHWRFFASIDLFAFPWWKYRISKESQGVDGMFQATYTPRHDLTMYVTYRYKRKERDVTGTSGSLILPTHQHKARYRLSYTPTDRLQLRTTIDYTLFNQQTSSRGYLFTQMFSYKFPFGLSATLQGSYFHTDDYDSRVYASERGLLYTFTTSSYSGRGFRHTTCLRYEPSSHFVFLLKLGQTIYQNKDEISSGNDLIEDNKKTDLQLQVKIKI